MVYPPKQSRSWALKAGSGAKEIMSSRRLVHGCSSEASRASWSPLMRPTANSRISCSAGSSGSVVSRILQETDLADSIIALCTQSSFAPRMGHDRGCQGLEMTHFVTCILQIHVNCQLTSLDDCRPLQIAHTVSLKVSGVALISSTYGNMKHSEKIKNQSGLTFLRDPGLQ